LINTGQADLRDIKIYLESNFDYSLNQSYISLLKAGESFKNSLNIFVDENATLGVSTIKLKVESQEINYSKDIGLTVLEKKKSLTTGFAIKIPQIKISKEYYYLAIFAVASFLTSFLLKRIRKMREKKRDYSDFFSLLEDKS